MANRNSEANTEIFLENYRTYIYNILRNFIKDEKIMSRMLDQESMAVWVDAVTHNSVNPANNYENLEARGDFILKSSFAEYLYVKFQNIDKDTITNINHFYMSTEYESRLCKEMKLDKYIRLTGEITNKILEDVFESFFGALMKISTMVTHRGDGFNNCVNLITLIFNKITIDRNTVDSPKTKITQWLRRLGYPSVVYSWYSQNSDENPRIGDNSAIQGKDGKYRLRLSINKYAKDNLGGFGITVPLTYELAIANSYKGAEKKAFREMYEIWISAGMTGEFVDKTVTTNKFLGNGNLSIMGSELQNKVKEQGFDDIKFEVPSNMNTQNTRYISLVAIKREDPQKNRLMGTESYKYDPNNELGMEIEARIRLVEKVLRTGN